MSGCKNDSCEFSVKFIYFFMLFFFCFDLHVCAMYAYCNKQKNTVTTLI